MNTSTLSSAGILLLTIAISLLALYRQPRLIELCLFRPYYLVRNQQYHTLLSSGLVHGSATHLLFNMLTFYFFGPTLEQTIGTIRFIVLYVLALALSEVRTYLQHRNDHNYASLGASGAVSAVLFASIVYFPNQSLFILPISFPIPVPLFAVSYLIYSWYLGKHGQDNINHTAHIDGALTGLLFVAVTDSNAYAQLWNMMTQ
ncbi:MAG: rhomboid family intramembrane serine protease [Steroidobacteraceae bacterium]